MYLKNNVSEYIKRCSEMYVDMLSNSVRTAMQRTGGISQFDQYGKNLELSVSLSRCQYCCLNEELYNM